MGKGDRPKDGRPQRDRRPGRAGVGPGPAYRPSSSGGGTKHTPDSPTRGCCPMVAALGALSRGRYRLARRYAAMSVRLMAARAIPDPRPAGGPLPKPNHGRKPSAPPPHRSSGKSSSSVAPQILYPLVFMYVAMGVILAGAGVMFVVRVAEAV